MMSGYPSSVSREQIAHETAASLNRWRAAAGTRDFTVFLEAILAIGRRRTYGMPCTSWKTYVQTMSDHDLTLHVQAVEQLTEECVRKLTATSFEPSGAPVAVAWGRPVDDHEGLLPVLLIRDRMSLLFAVHAFEWIFSQRSAVVHQHEEDRHKGGPEQQYGQLSVRINAYDAALQDETLSLYTAARGRTLAEMRAFIASSKPLPWWLDGTLEALCLARMCDQAEWQELSAVFKIYGFGRPFRQALLDAMDGPGAEVMSHTQRRGQRGRQADRYAWKAADCDARIELLVTHAGGRAPTLEFRIDDACDLDFGASFVGAMMFLNGMPVRWVWHAQRGITARVTSSEFPTTGTLVLVDCRTYKVLVPTSPA